MTNTKKVILDLCGGTGSWSKPYQDAGYDVKIITLPEHNVLGFDRTQNLLTFWGNKQSGSKDILVGMDDIYGILAAPPCTMFSLARTKAKKPRDFTEGMEIVRACMNIIWTVREQKKLAFWAVENPMGYLRQFLGAPAFTFDPSQFHETYNKTTDLWGYFKAPNRSKKARYASTDDNTRELPNIPEKYKRDYHMSPLQIKRSITPEGFAKAFFKSNQ